MNDSNMLAGHPLFYLFIFALCVSEAVLKYLLYI